MMRALALTLCVALVHIASCKSAYNKDFSQWLSDRAALIKRTNRYISDLINTEEGLRKVRGLLDYVDSMRDGLTDLEAKTLAQNLKSNEIKRNKESIFKKEAFWQPMGGPLPVETRLASFGSRIIPDRSGPSPMVKPMRYGKRSAQ